jgi:hypothetical protein
MRDAFEAMKSSFLTSGLAHAETLQTLLQVRVLVVMAMRVCL